jgi:hypothetical protein
VLQRALRELNAGCGPSSARTSSIAPGQTSSGASSGGERLEPRARATALPAASSSCAARSRGAPRLRGRAFDTRRLQHRALGLSQALEQIDRARAGTSSSGRIESTSSSAAARAVELLQALAGLGGLHEAIGVLRGRKRRGAQARVDAVARPLVRAQAQRELRHGIERLGMPGLARQRQLEVAVRLGLPLLRERGLRRGARDAGELILLRRARQDRHGQAVHALRLGPLAARGASRPRRAGGQVRAVGRRGAEQRLGAVSSPNRSRAISAARA